MGVRRRGGTYGFTGGVAGPPQRYGRQALKSWARRSVGTWPPDKNDVHNDVHVYFNNGLGGAAVVDAAKFARAAAALAGR
ncbi:hypothetical protein [Streptomyces sp. NPDC058695]|uniref:hypothetical protein n=1 Tax=Streptomyces sp. NPDC058695 TaxID=3346604 RepID=UPI00365D76D6